MGATLLALFAAEAASRMVQTNSIKLPSTATPLTIATLFFLAFSTALAITAAVEGAVSSSRYGLLCHVSKCTKGPTFILALLGSIVNILVVLHYIACHFGWAR